MRYEWNRSRGVSAQVVGETVERLSDVNGGVCPSWALVDEARPEGSALHPMFEWNDWTAAEAFRREQARHHIRELRVVTADDEEPVQAFVHIVRVGPDGPVEGYRSTRLVVREKGEYAQVMNDALSGLRAWERRYKHLSELEKVFDVIAEVIR